MSGEKEVRITYKTEVFDDGSIRVVFSKEVPGKGKVIIFEPDVLYELADERASEYEIGPGEREWAVTLEDMDDDDEGEDDNDGAGIPVSEPMKVIDVDAEIVDEKKTGGA